MKTLSVLLVLTCGFFSLVAQSTLLERRITLTLEGETVEASLRKISEAGNFIFSYSPAILDGGETVHHRFVNRTVREVLDQLFAGTLRYTVRGNYIILTRETPQRSDKETTVITGFVVDEDTGKRLENVSVYDPVTLSSAITDSKGYFRIAMEQPASEVILAVNRQDYQDTVVVLPWHNRLLQIPIRLHADKITAVADTLGSRVQQIWNKRKSTRDSVVVQPDDTLYRVAQMSFVPFLGTNGKLSDQTINQYSLNVLGGQALGLQKVEVAGLFNMERGPVSGVQFAGLYNGVAGSVNGAQIAGVTNVTKSTSTGVQVAGVTNITVDATRGAQIAGVANLTLGAHRGVQLAGVTNLATDDYRGAQLSGAVSIAVRDARGLQMGGLANIALKRFRGVQVAGFLNYAGINEGVQIAPFNIADSSSGVPLGVISFVRKGYHKIEVSVDEVFYNNVSFRTGADRFYNILTVGAKPSSYKEAETFWTFGYGFGTAPRLVGRRLFLNVDLTSNQIVHGNRIENLDLLNKLYLGLDYAFLKKVSLAVGATWNVNITQRAAADYPALFTDYQPHIFFDHAGDHHRTRMWIGGKIALRFL